MTVHGIDLLEAQANAITYASVHSSDMGFNIKINSCSTKEDVTTNGVTEIDKHLLIPRLQFRL